MQLDITMVDEIEELQDQYLSSYVENRDCNHGATKSFKTGQLKNTVLYSKTRISFLERYCYFLLT